MLSGEEYRSRDAVGLAELVRGGEVTAREVLDAAIDEIERLDPALNAVVMRNYEKAREEADAVDRSVPLAGEPPLETGLLAAFVEEGLEAWNQRSWRFAPYTEPFNVTGQPAMSVPLHQGIDGLPIGMHFVGCVGEDARLLRLARQLEEAAPWARRRPPDPT